MTRIDLRREETEGGNNRKIDSVLDRDQTGIGPRIQLRHRRRIARIDFRERQIFVDQFRLEVPQPGQFVRHGIVVPPRDYHARDFVAAERNPLDGQLLRFPPPVSERIEGKFLLARPPLAISGEKRHQVLRHRNLVYTVLGQTHPDRVPDAVRKQRTDADGTFDPSVLAITRFGHTEMDRIVPIRPFRGET